MKEKKGAVYFLKMNKVDAVKIGHTNQEDVFSRIYEVKTYCPYGAELIGFFTSYEANKIKKTLHEKFKIHRLKGEWFNISIEECLKCIEFYREQNEINDRQRKDLSTKALTMLLKSYCKKNYKTFLDGNSNGVRWFSIS